MPEKQAEKSGRWLRTSAIGAMVAAIAMMAVPGDAFAQNRGDGAREWQRSQQHSQRTVNRGNSGWNNRTRDVQSRQSTRGAERRGDARAARVDRNSERAARRTDRRAEVRSNRSEQRAQRRAEQTREYQRERSSRDWNSRDRNDRNRWARDRSERERANRERNVRNYNRGDQSRNYQRYGVHRNAPNNHWREGRRYTQNADHRRWNRSWRRNDRYNWQQHRARNQHIYRIGRYHPPASSYRYRRIGIGVSLGSLFYSNRYWINDPWSYRLPSVYGPYRWVRYYDDVLLVNVHTGRVMDVIHNFFW